MYFRMTILFEAADRSSLDLAFILTIFTEFKLASKHYYDYEK